MKTIIVVSFIFAFSFVAYCQSNKPDINIVISTKFQSQDSINTQPKDNLELKTKDKTGFTFPVQFGGELGKGFAQLDNRNWNMSYWNAFLSIHLYDRRIFLTMEYGESHSPSDQDRKGFYVGLGVNYRVFEENNHIIFLGVSILPNIFSLPYMELSTKYLYALNDFIALEASGKFFFHFLIKNYLMSLNAGIQIFAN